MKKADAILSVRLLADSLLIPSVRAYADDDSPGNHRQREALRQDQRKLEQLRDPVRFASAAKFRRNVAQARRSEIPDPVLTLRIRPGWKDQSAATSENPPIILISAFEIADDRVRGGISRLLEHLATETHHVAFESRVGMSNRDFL